MTGARQGENLDPFLFSIFLNDLENFLDESHCSPLQLVSDLHEQYIGILLKIFDILYADDTKLIAESKDGMQYALNLFKIFKDAKKRLASQAQKSLKIFGTITFQLTYS